MSCHGLNGKDTTAEHFVIIVKNLPADLDKDGINSIFAQYGNVTGVSPIKSKVPGTTEAYVSYSKYADAERAFNALHNQPPLLLQIHIRGKREVNFEPEQKCDLSKPIPDWRFQDNYLEHAVRGKKVIDVGRAHVSPGYRPPTYTSDDDILYNVPTDSSIFNPYEPPGPYRETNLMYTRGVAHVTKDGRRHVSFGRGYTYYNLPEPHYNISTYVQNVAERREKDIYEYAPDAEDEEIGKCKVCSESTPFMCHKCSVTYYCSKRCQQKDWNDHKNECQPIPPLVKKVRGKSLDRKEHITTSEVSQKEDENNESSQKPSLRRPKTSQPLQHQRQLTPPREIVTESNNCRSPPRTQQNGQVTSQPSPVKSISSRDEQTKDLSKPQTPVGTFKVESTSFPAKQPYQKQQQYQQRQQPQQQPSYQKQQPQQQSSPPQAHSPRGFCAPQPKAVTPDRTLLTEQMATCNLNSEQPSEKELAYAKIANLPNVLDKLEVNKIGSIILGARIAETEFSATLVPNPDEFELLIDDLRVASIDMFQKNPNYCPKVGEFVSGQDGEDWYRGIVVSTTPKVQLAIIDECRFCTPKKCVPLQDKFKNINTLGLSCQFLKGTKLPVDTADQLAGALFKATQFTGPSRASALIEIMNSDGAHFGTAGIKRWEPKPEQKGIQQVALKSGVEVIITDSTDQNLIYVRNHDPIENDRFHLLEQDIARYAQNRKRLSQAPVVGQMVLAKYVDDNFYRALVINVEGHLIVKFVDYGNEEEVIIDGLFELPDTLKEFPAAVTKISLKGVNKEVPMTKEARDYINELIGHAVPLTCTFNGHPIEDGVYLKTPKKEDVNSILNDLLKPTWEKETSNEEKKVYGIENLPAIKLGNVGEEVQAIVLSYMPDAALFVLGPNDEVAVLAIQVQMVEQAKEYVKKTKSHYIPRNNELCIAKYGDEYYRGLCIVSSLSPTESQIFFIDYGNTERVLHKDIRPITEDFLSIGALGSICTISTMVDTDKISEKVTQCIMKHAPADEIITIKILSIGDDESLDIDIPELRVKLIDEGLL